MVKQYLKENQKIVFQVLKNSFSSNKTSHAYILNGNKGSNLLDTAIFIAQSLICHHKDEDNLACEECIACQKIKNQTYADFKLIKGEDLKNDITLSIQEEFNKSAIEQENQKIYIIDLIENAPVASLNKLLKFIEDPTSNIVAIFTSNSVNKVLPTIVSRCQVITFKEFKTQDLVDYLLSNGISKDDAYIVSKISNNAEKNLELINHEQYKKVKEYLGNALTYLANKKDYFIVYCQIEFLKNIEDFKMIELFLDMMEVCLLEAIIKKEDNSYEVKFFKEQIELLSKNYEHLDHMIYDITNAKIDLLSNANKQLTFDKLLINLLRR